MNVPLVHAWAGDGLPTLCCGKRPDQLPIDAQGSYDPLRVTCPASAAEAGAWIAYYTDYSGLALFADELSALRHAVANGMQVMFVRHGEDIR